MKRTPAINFTNYSDYSDYSDGETSEDLKNSKNITKETPQVVINKQIGQHLESIDTNITKIDCSVNITQFNENDFNLEQKLISDENLKTQNFQTDTTHIVVPHAAQFVKNEISHHVPYVSFQRTNVAFAEFSTGLNSCYRQSYASIYTTIKATFYISPSAEKLNSLSLSRRDGSIGRQLFHYIGYGFPAVDKANIYICDGKPTVFKPYSIKKLFENLKTPSFYVFDCDNAGSVIQSFKAIASRCNEKSASSSPKGRESKAPFINPKLLQMSTNWDNWYCICATDVNESLPSDFMLPRDFLTSCVFHPVSLSILCHILQYYRTSFDDPSFPFNELKGILAYNDDKCARQMDEILHTLTDAIASDYLKPQLFTTLFRSDCVVSAFYRGFVLAQYLLSPYEVHPVSNPSLPSMTKHQLWQQWNMCIDQWITSTLTPIPSFANDFFSRSTSTFKVMLENNMDHAIKNFLLTILCHLPFTEVKSKDEAYHLLAKYAEKSPIHRSKITGTVIFQKLFALITTTKEPELRSLCYIVLALLRHHPQFVNDISTDNDFATLVEMLFDESISEKSRTMIAAIYSVVISGMKNVKAYFKEAQFFPKLKKAIKAASPELLQWLLILTRRIYEGERINATSFVPDSVHFQIAVEAYHDCLWCRASALSNLPLFLQPGDQIINLHLILIAIPAFADVSYLVRLQILHFASLFISQNTEMFTTGFRKSRFANTACSYSQLIAMWYDDLDMNKIANNFKEFALQVDKVAHRTDAIQFTCQILYYIIDMYSHDPHQYIKRIATKARVFFQKLAVGNNDRDRRASSISPPYGHDILQKKHVAYSEDESEFTEESEYNPIDTDSEALYSCTLDKIVRNGITEKEVINKVCNIEEKPMPQLSDFSVEIRADAHQFKFPLTHIAFHPSNLNITVSTSNKWIFNADENCNVTSKIRLSDYEITDLDYTSICGTSIIIAATSDGCVHLWNPSIPLPCASFRADANYNCDNIPQFVTSRGTNLYTTRGNSGVALWDIASQKIVGEWMSDEQSIATAIGLHPVNPSVAIVGYANGAVNTIDIRAPIKISRMTVSPSDPITHISGINDLIYVSSNHGKCAILDSLQNTFSLLSSASSVLKQFTIHSKYPLAMMCDTKTPPQIATPDGTPFYSFSQVSPTAIFKFHTELPVVAFGTQQGELLTYKFL